MAANDELRAWLDAHDLGGCAQALIDNQVGLDLLPELSDEDLASIGLVLGLRRRLQRAAAELGAAKAASPPAPPNPATAAPPAARAAAANAGERRHLAVLVCDLVDSTAMASRLDAEDWHELVAAYQASVAEVVARFGGHIAKHLGDGALVYFGYPHAQENDAERAVRAGLGIQDALAALNQRLAAGGKPPLATRVGLHAGMVVVGDDADMSGDVPGLAAQTQSAGDPGDVLVSEDVHRLVAGQFLIEDRGARAFKGVVRPIRLYRVVRASGSRRRHTGQALSPLLGRDEELAVLASRWRRARGGEGQVVTIIGEAGFGKSRLLEEFQRGLSDTPHTWIAFPCSQLLANAPFHPLVEWARERFGSADEAHEPRIAELEKAFAALDFDPAEMVPLIAPLLDIAVPARYAAPALPPEEKRRRQLAALVKWVLGGARVQPVVTAIEDVHWADPSTLDLLRSLVDQGASSRLLVVLTARPEFRASWPHRSHHSVVALAPLGASDTAGMVSAIAARHALSVETVAAVVARSGGVPLFVEEVTRLLLESGDRGGTQDIPSTLRASLAARLDRMGAAKEVAQIGAVVGREFGWGLIKAMTSLADEPLRSALERLSDADLIQAEGVPPEARYRFKHALVQDAAYEALLKNRRRELHRLAALTLPVHDKALADSHPELLAHHLTEGGETEAAVAAWQRAADAAMARNAFSEAIVHYRRALGLLGTVADGEARGPREFMMRMNLAHAIRAIHGLSAAETFSAYEEALSLGERLGNVAAITPVLAGLVSATYNGGRFDAALVLADRLATLAPAGGGRLAEGFAKLTRGVVSFWTGQLAKAMTEIDDAIAVAVQGDRIALSGMDLAVVAGLYRVMGLVLWGRLDAAKEYAAALVARGEASKLTPSRGMAALGGSYCAEFRGDTADMSAHADMLSAIGRDSQISLYVAAGDLFHGVALVRQDRAPDGLALVEDAVASLLSQGLVSFRPYLLCLLAEARLAAGDWDGALAAVDEGIAPGPGRLRSVVFGPRLRSIGANVALRKAETLDAAGAAAQAAAAASEYRTAAAEARATGARMLELHASTGLARLLGSQGDHAAARELLVPVSRWFTEGLDTVSLTEAAAVLGGLA